MNAFRYGLLIAGAAAIASIVVAAEVKEQTGASAALEHKMFDAATIQWGDAPPGFPAGAKFAVLSGDPGKDGVYTVRLKAPAGYKIMPHTHPTAELVTVVSGSLHVGMGPKFDEDGGHQMAQGGFMDMPAGMQHFAWTTEESVIQVHGQGPFAINYVNAADDPRNAKK